MLTFHHGLHPLSQEDDDSSKSEAHSSSSVVKGKRTGGNRLITAAKDSVLTSKRLLSRTETAGVLGISPQTLAQWASSRRFVLPYVSIGRKAMYRLEDIEKFIEANLHNAFATTGGMK